MIKAVIIAAGNGTRMRPLTLTRPKPLLKIIDRTILEHNLKQLKGLVEEVIIVIGYKETMIRSVIGDFCNGIKISYVVQESQFGTGDAAKKAIHLIDSKFILLSGDDIYFKEDIKECLKKCPSILLSSIDNPSSFGVVECNNNFVKSLVEKPENPSLDSLVSTGLYFLDKSIFNFNIKKSPRGEYEFTDYIRALIVNQNLYFKKTDKWIPVSYPWNFLEANEIMLENIKRSIMGKVESNCSIIGKIVIEKGSLIKGGTQIEGPVYIRSGTIVGPNAFIRGKTVIGQNCRIGAGVEIKNSVIGDGTNVPHLSYVGDSVIGENCNIGGGTVMANFRFDSKNIRVDIKGNKIDTRRSKLGSILGDNVSIGINCSLMPGTMIASNFIMEPNSVIKGTKYESDNKKNKK